MSIAILYKPETIEINPNYTGGQERVFINDALMIAKMGKLHSSWGGAHFSSKKIKKKIKYKQILFCRYEINSRADKIFAPFFKIIYSLQFFFLARKAHYWYVFGESIPAIFFPSKTVISFHDVPHLFMWKYLHFRYKKTKFLFCSEFLKNLFKQKYPGLDDNKLLVISNAVSTNNEEAYKKIIKKDSIKVLFASAWVREKGIFTFTNVAKKMIEEKIPIKFFIAGSTDLWRLSFSKEFAIEMKNLVNKVASSQINILGSLNHPDLVRTLASMDYLIFPSTRIEPAPLICLESLSVGTPVLAYKTGGVSEMIVDGKNGQLINKSRKNLYVALKEIALKRKRYKRSEIINSFPLKHTTKNRYAALHDLFV